MAQGHSKKPEMVDKVIKANCQEIYFNDISRQNLFVCASAIYENVLKDLLRIHEKQTFTNSLVLNDLIIKFKGRPDIFPQKFIAWINRVRWKGNKVRHQYLDGIDDHDLEILRLEVFSFLEWYFVEVLKSEIIPEMEKWYSEKYGDQSSKLQNALRAVSILQKKIGDSENDIRTKEGIIEENLNKIFSLNQSITHYQQMLKNFKERENELSKEIIRLRQKL